MARLWRVAALLLVISAELCWEGALSTRAGSEDTEERVPDVHLRDLKLFDFPNLFDPNSKEEQALIMAATDGDLERVEELLGEGVSPNVTTARDATPLMLASFRGHLEIVETLIEAGADVSRTDVDERTALHYASQKNHTLVASLLLDNGAELNKQGVRLSTPLFVAAQQDATGTVEFLLGRDGIEVELMDFRGWTPLIVAADTGRVGSVGLLLESGANIMATTQARETALHRAALAFNSTSVIDLLLENGAEIDAVDFREDTALEFASWAGNTPAVEALMLAGANASIPDTMQQVAADALCACLTSQRCASPCDQITNETIIALLNGEMPPVRPPTEFSPSPVPGQEEPPVLPEDKPLSPEVIGGAGMSSKQEWFVACLMLVVSLVSLLEMW